MGLGPRKSYPERIVLPDPANQGVVSPDDQTPFRFSENELDLYDQIAGEQIAHVGTELVVYQLDIVNSKVDPLYGEPQERVFKGPYQMFAHVAWPEASPAVGEAGKEFEWPSAAWLPRMGLEKVGARAPLEGDIVRFWDLPYFVMQASGYAPEDADAGYYFQVIKVNNDGHLFDSAKFVGFRLDLKRLSAFSPERLFGK